MIIQQKIIITGCFVVLGVKIDFNLAIAVIKSFHLAS